MINKNDVHSIRNKNRKTGQGSHEIPQFTIFTLLHKKVHL